MSSQLGFIAAKVASLVEKYLLFNLQ